MLDSLLLKKTLLMIGILDEDLPMMDFEVKVLSFDWVRFCFLL